MDNLTLAQKLLGKEKTTENRSEQANPSSASIVYMVAVTSSSGGEVVLMDEIETESEWSEGDYIEIDDDGDFEEYESEDQMEDVDDSVVDMTDGDGVDIEATDEETVAFSVSEYHAKSAAVYAAESETVEDELPDENATITDEIDDGDAEDLPDVGTADEDALPDENASVGELVDSDYELVDDNSYDESDVVEGAEASDGYTVADTIGTIKAGDRVAVMIQDGKITVLGVVGSGDEMAALVSNAQEAADEAAQAAEVANELANEAANLANDAQSAADAAQNAADTARESANNATQKAEAAQAAVDVVEGNVTGLVQTIDNAQKAADNAQEAAETADQKAVEAAQAAANAQSDATKANQAAGVAKDTADQAVENAQTAQVTAEQAKKEAAAAQATVDATKKEVEAAKEEIANLGDSLGSLSNTMSADYAKKGELSSVEATLQTQIKQNAAEISTNASMIQTVDETANNAKEQAEQAQSSATLAKQQADTATADAAKAQTAADNAKAAADSAQSEADKANQAAATAKGVADKAAEDLAAAEADLATVSGRVAATEEEIIAAQNAVNVAQAAADKAKADALEASQKAATAQNTADSAVTKASTAQSAADDAAAKAQAAQNAANTAQENAEKAQTKANEAATAAANAQTTADKAVTNAAAAQTKANQAAADALAAQTAADDADAKAAQAQTDLNTAKENLAAVESRVDATEEEVEAAKADVVKAQSKADEAAQNASAAQTAADKAKADALAAQNAADTAKAAADKAQADATEAKKAADEAQAAADALAIRVTAAETDIQQNAEQISLMATKTEVAQHLGNYYTKTESDANLIVKAEEITSNVSKTYATKADLTAAEQQAAADAQEALAAANQAKASAKTANDDLATAKQNLETVKNRVDATESDIAAAELAVAAAQKKADDANTAAVNAQNDATKALADLDTLADRVETAETNISQTSEQITLNASKIVEVESKTNGAISETKRYYRLQDATATPPEKPEAGGMYNKWYTPVDSNLVPYDGYTLNFEHSDGAYISPEMMFFKPYLSILDATGNVIATASTFDCMVEWDGVEYECAFTEENGAFYSGNLSLLDATEFEDTGEPFCVIQIFLGIYEGKIAIYTIFVTTDDSSQHTVKITDKYVDSVQLVYEDSNGDVVPYPSNVFSFVKATEDISVTEVEFGSYEESRDTEALKFDVIFDGVKYIIDNYIEEDGGIFGGNLNIINSDYEDTGEPFTIILTPSIYGPPYVVRFGFYARGTEPQHTIELKRKMGVDGWTTTEPSTVDSTKALYYSDKITYLDGTETFSDVYKSGSYDATQGVAKDLAENHYTKTETDSAITVKADEIKQEVSQSYQVKGDYPTKTEMNSAITTKANEISLEVSETYQVKGDYAIKTETEAKIKVESDRITQTVSDVSALGTRLTTTEQTAEGLKTTVNGLNGRLSTVEQTANGLSSRVQLAEGDIDDLQTGAANMQTQIDQNATNINLRATKTELSAVDTKATAANNYVNNEKNNYGYQYKTDVTIYGDANTYYPVIIRSGDQNVMREIFVKRAYSEKAPADWDGHPTAKGISLTLKIKCNFGGWGGAQYFWNIVDLAEQYGNVFAGAENCMANMAFAIFLRGGGETGALYHLYSDQSLTATSYGYTSPNICYNQELIGESGDTYKWYAPAPRTLTDEVLAEIEAKKFVYKSTMDAAIDVKADEINLSVSQTYATIDQANSIIESIEEQSTNIKQTAEEIVSEATKSMATTDDLESYREDLSTQITQTAKDYQIAIEKATAPLDAAATQNAADLEIFKRFFDFSDGLTLKTETNGVEGPFKAKFTEAYLAFLINGIEAILLDPDGHSTIPDLHITNAFNLFGLTITKDAAGNINAE